MFVTAVRVPHLIRLYTRKSFGTRLQNLRKQHPTLNDGNRVICCRHLYSAEALGIDGFVRSRESTLMEYQNIQDSFREQMKKITESESQTMIFSEDLKNVIHLANSEEDISLVLKMAEKFNSQHKGLRFGEYVFGPVIMRMFHHLDQPDYMLKALNSEELLNFFDQTTSYHLVVDLLFKHERYQEVVDVFEQLQDRRIKGKKYPKACLLITFAALYKINTQASFDKMMELVNGAQDYGTHLNIRSLSFAAALAINQGHPHIAYEMLSQVRSSQISIRNLKVLSLISLDKIEKAIPLLRSLLQFDHPDSTVDDNSKVFIDTIEKLEEAMEKLEDKELLAECQHTVKGLKDYGFIFDKTLDEYLSIPIPPFDDQLQNRDRFQNKAMLAASFNRDTRHLKGKQLKNRRRPGLMDME